MSRWFRHYTGMMRDEKLVSAAVKSKQPVERVVWVWGAILESASEIDDAGRYELDAAEAAYFLRADEADICSILDALANAGRVSAGVVVRWSDRQYQSDKSADRQARYRERKRQGSSDSNETNSVSDGGVTSRDGVMTPPDTDTDTDKGKEEPSGSSKKRGCRLPADFVPDIGFAISLGLTRSQAENEAIKFREWWPAQPGQRGVKLDWGLTWQTWCRKALERQPRGSPAFSKPDHFANLAQELSDEQNRSHRSDNRDWDDAQGVPVLAIDYERR